MSQSQALLAGLLTHDDEQADAHAISLQVLLLAVEPLLDPRLVDIAANEELAACTILLDLTLEDDANVELELACCMPFTITSPSARLEKDVVWPDEQATVGCQQPHKEAGSRLEIPRPANTRATLIGIGRTILSTRHHY